jgi:hypothetical protein
MIRWTQGRTFLTKTRRKRGDGRCVNIGNARASGFQPLPRRGLHLRVNVDLYIAPRLPHSP